MCASFGDKYFENLRLEFHKSSNLMSEVLKKQCSHCYAEHTKLLCPMPRSI
jgi:hypothetical protein